MSNTPLPPTQTLKTAFIAAYRVTGNVAAAAREVGVHRGTPHTWRERDTEFAQAWEDAREALADELEQEARRRALVGVEDYVVSNGKLVMDPDDPGKPLLRRVYSDKLMELLLRGHRPSVYGVRQQIEHSGSVRTIQELLIGIPAGEEDDPAPLIEGGEAVPMLGDGGADVLTDGRR